MPLHKEEDDALCYFSYVRWPKEKRERLSRSPLLSSLILGYQGERERCPEICSLSPSPGLLLMCMLYDTTRGGEERRGHLFIPDVPSPIIYEQ